MKRIGLIISLFFAAVISVNAQNNSAPYSILGIGDIESSYFDRASGMANTGMSLTSNRFLYHSNPASYSNLDNHWFHAEIALRFKYSSYNGSSLSQYGSNTATDLQAKKIAIAIKIKKRWASSIGLMPYSSSNYSFYAPKTVLGTPYSTNAYYEGSGGINQIYFANSFAINKNLSIGVHSAFLFGNMQQKETISAGLIDSLLVTTKNTYYNNPYFKFGLQYHKQISPKLKLGFGATGSLQTKLRSTQSLLVQQGLSTVYTNNFYATNFYKLPYTYGAGVSAVIKDKFTFATDYNHQSWSYLNYTGVGYTLTNSDRYSVGFEYSKKVKYRDFIFEKYYFQSGLFYNNSYVVLNTQQINDVGGSVGAGFNSLKGLSLMGALEFGRRGTISNGLVKENYVQFTIGISYRDFWFTKIKRYD